jgi:serpin B
MPHGILPGGCHLPAPAPQQITAEYLESVKSFSFNLLAKVLEKAGAHENVFASPVSVATALTLAMNGADGATLKGMQKALEASNMSLDEVNGATRAFIDLLQTLDKDVIVNIANSIWPSDKVNLVQDFDNKMRSEFGADIRSLDYDDEDAAKAVIHGWVDNKTQGMIKEILDKLPQDTLAVLVNAIYFKGMWTNSFDKKQTQDLPFTVSDGTKKDVPMMRRFDKFEYMNFQQEGFEAIRLPYGNNKTSMIVMLPHANSSIEDLQKSLDSAKWSSVLADLDSAGKREGTIMLPRFKAEYKTELKDALSQMGMPEAFSNYANFSKMIEPPDSMKIDKVLHKAVLDVNEDGTKAAAVTAIIGVRTTSVSVGPRPFFMNVNRPFFVAIEAEGVPLFYGSIKNPE